MKAGEKAEGQRQHGIGQELRKAGIPAAGRPHTAAPAVHPGAAERGPWLIGQVKGGAL